MQKEEHYMESMLYVGMDVHTSNYTLCTYSIEADSFFLYFFPVCAILF